VTVTPNPEPGSTPPSWVQGSQLDATNGAWFFVPWGGLTFTFQPSAGDWQFRFAGGGGYYGTPLFGGVHCENQQVNGVTCTVCSGSGGSMTLYAQYGGIEGDVFNAASRVKVGGGGLSVGVTLLEGGGSVFGQSPDENGHFAFRGGGEFYQNGWGLPVYCETPGECGSRPTALYKVWLYPDEYVPAGVASSEVTYVELEYKPPYHEPPCDPCDPSCTDPRAGSSKSCPPCPPKSVGKPVDVLSGNMYFDQTDAAVAGIGPSLALTRTYNSQNVAAGRYGLFGPGWFSTFERRITFPEPVVAMLRQGTGRVLYFQDVDGDGTFVPSAPATERSQIVRQADGSYLRPFPAGGSESYDSAGRLVALTDAAGNSLTITRDASGLMTAVTEPGGRALRFEYLTGIYGTRVKSVSGPQGPIAIYEYDYSPGYLQSVSYPEGGSYSFVYDANGRLTQVSDSTGRIVETHAYDSQGRATTSEVADGREKYTLAYAANQTTVTDALGNATVYEWEPIRGLRRVTKVSGPCPSCGGGESEVQEWTYV
jgi:YD repeat-containing protein